MARVSVSRGSGWIFFVFLFLLCALKGLAFALAAGAGEAPARRRPDLAGAGAVGRRVAVRAAEGLGRSGFRSGKSPRTPASPESGPAVGSAKALWCVP